MRRFVALLGVISLSLAMSFGPAPARAGEDEAERGETARSGLPLPRFAALSAGKVNVRRGPGKIYPIDWIFVRRGLPVEIVAEWDLWRKIRDADGTAGWVHKSMLSGQRTALVLGETRALRKRPDPDADVIADVEAGVIAKLLSCHGAWCRIDADGNRGWLARSELWGAYPREEID